jgi:hypothetical protein
MSGLHGYSSPYIIFITPYCPSNDFLLTLPELIPPDVPLSIVDAYPAAFFCFLAATCCADVIVSSAPLLTVVGAALVVDDEEPPELTEKHIKSSP